MIYICNMLLAWKKKKKQQQQKNNHLQYLTESSL